jgi:ribosomal protein S12 methylthiotransferase accessory factor
MGAKNWWALDRAPSLKISTLSHRTVPPTQTEARLKECASRIPITRVADLTPLDPLRLPVFSATTPMATDLTTHLGKGLDACSARVSAMTEALERHCAESTTGPVLKMSYRDMIRAGHHTVDPCAFELPADSGYRDTQVISWVEGRDLLQDKSTWIPLDLVLSPPTEGVLLDVDTNGLAAGNTHLEAIVHGLCEVIERDSLGQHLFVEMFGDAGESGALVRNIDPATLPGTAMAWRRHIEETGQSLDISCVTTEIGVPVFRTVLVDHAYPRGGRFDTRRFLGFGASPNSEVALLRSITEAVQSRVAVVQGARDSFNSLSAGARFIKPQAMLNDFQSSYQTHFDDIATFSTDDLREDMQFLGQALQNAGIESIIAVNLSREAPMMPVVRVRVPGLCSFLGNRRRLGWRCLRHLL